MYYSVDAPDCLKQSPWALEIRNLNEVEVSGMLRTGPDHSIGLCEGSSCSPHLYTSI